jgi:aspartyl-tRNA(Asn)/glutamyl-tRNA(Gln) amidotransferase subunit C
MLTIKEVEYVALLARLELTDAEKQIYVRQLGDILEYAKMFNELDTSGVPPTAHVLPLKNVFRNDSTGEHLPSEKVLVNAPDRDKEFFKVPRIV